MTRSLVQWLELHGMEKFAPVFEQNEIDLDTLRILTDADLEQIGLPFGPRKKLLHLIAASAPVPVKPRQVGESQERRQVTALFSDMVGFTELSTRIDPETLHGVMHEYETACAACIARYEGYMLPTLGDGVVAVFGFPLAHEGEAQRAVNAGLDILKAISELKVATGAQIMVRVGIATGLVVVDSAGQNRAVGETLNLASRLQTIAEPGQIVVDERTRRLADGGFAFDELGEKLVKGIAGPVRVHGVVGRNDAQSRFEASTHRGLTPLVGRDEEIEHILDCWRAIRERRVGHAIVLVGEAGIGKSRIVEAVRERLRAELGQTLLFQCSPLMNSSAFYPVKSGIEHALGATTDAEQKLDRLDAMLVGRLGLPRTDMSFIAAMLSLPYEARYGAIAVSPKLAKDETMRALADMLAAEAQAQPTLVLFEDAHWADPTSLELLNRVVGGLARTPALLIITARPEFKPAFPTGSQLSTIALDKLSPQETNDLLKKVTGGRALPQMLVDEIIRRTDGVPLFVEELTKAILESGDLVIEDGKYAYARTSTSLTIPETLRDSLMARLDRVAAAKEIAQIGSVIGRDFSYEIVAGLNQISEGVLADSLQLLTSSELARRHGSIPNAIYTFSHALVQDVAYDSLLKSRRKQLHANVARTMEALWPQTRATTPELLARHYTAAEEYVTATPLWLSAGRFAIQRFSMEEAIVHLRTGLELLEHLPHDRTRDQLELSLRATLGPALVAYHGWGHNGVGQALEPAWRLAQTLNERRAYLPLLNTLSVHTMCIDQLATSLEWAERLVKTGSTLGDGDLEIAGFRAISACRYWLGDFADARAAGDRVLAMYDQDKHKHVAAITNNDPFTGEGIYRSQFLWMMGFPDQARAAHQAMESNARRRGHPFDLAFALTLGAQIYELLGESDALLARANEAERIGKEYGIPLLGEVLVEIGRGVAHLRLGQIDTGLAQLGLGLDRLKQTGHRIWIWYLQALKAPFLAQRGEVTRAVSMVEESLAHIEKGEDQAHYAEVLRLHGFLLKRQGETDRAEQVLRKAIDVARRQQAKSWELRACVTLARLLSGQGRGREAIDLLAPVCDWFTEGFETKDVSAAHALLDELRKCERAAG